MPGIREAPRTPDLTPCCERMSNAHSMGILERSCWRLWRYLSRQDNQAGGWLYCISPLRQSPRSKLERTHPERGNLKSAKSLRALKADANLTPQGTRTKTSDRSGIHKLLERDGESVDPIRQEFCIMLRSFCRIGKPILQLAYQPGVAGPRMR